jgi:hypothetical protein
MNTYWVNIVLNIGVEAKTKEEAEGKALARAQEIAEGCGASSMDEAEVTSAEDENGEDIEVAE